MNKVIELKDISLENEMYYMISNHDAMRPFLMSIVSDSNHWMFISSNGGLSAGRKDADNALFPYCTDDKLTEAYDTTGSKSIFWVTKNGAPKLWEPFSERSAGLYNCSRNVYKNALGNKILFEEINHDLSLTYRYQWSSSDQFGFVRKSYLVNNSDKAVSIKFVDGIQDIMPYGVNADLQGIRSNLVNAYKRSELDESSGLGIFALSAIIVDRAEPSEALKANIVWSLNVNDPTYLLSSTQLDRFRKGIDVQQETDVKAEKGAYFVSGNLQLNANDEQNWLIIANVNQGPSDISEISDRIRKDEHLSKEISRDIEKGSEQLLNLVYAADGLQLTSDKRRNTRHYSNTLFNIMRGGIFDNNYQIEKWDFKNYLENANTNTYQNHISGINELPDSFSYQKLKELSLQSDDRDFKRLVLEYMPLKFSRRHGDPSRPWNKFSINTKNEVDGSKVLDYEGNWRDIFQNWEALAFAYPEFIESMITKFLNASTFDGYNPYRVTKDGFDWEVIEEHDPWSYIGYWGDHQIIYLQKFLEFIENHYPGKLSNLFSQDLFVYANVPYKIKSYKDILKNPKDTIEFDYDLDAKIREKRDEIGADGGLLQEKDGKIYRVNFTEKILATALAKLSNFIPEAGIWLNTQRPEWNDANNALVGNGVSMVTLYYLRRFFNFYRTLLHSHQDTNNNEFAITDQLYQFYNGVFNTLKENESVLSGRVSNKQRKRILDGLGMAGSEYRNEIYENGFSGGKETVNLNELKEFTDLVLQYLDHSIDANKREDNMYHAYNLMTVENEEEVSVSYLDEMLEGQVAVLSSGYLSANASLELLNAVKESKLFREDQYSYLLYPNKELPKFVAKNIIPQEKIESSDLLKKLLADGNKQLIEKDINNQYHFNGSFKNADNLNEAFSELNSEYYKELIVKESDLILQIFEEVFNHKAFTGRSGTFYGYEGLGSIYWHMVSKFLLAVEECCVSAIKNNENEVVVGKLLEHFYEINEGIGAHKSPELYGAFPTDPYSHTPMGKGVQQPGMTGQVKEDILSRIGELGVFVSNGQIQFSPCLLRAEEFLKEASSFEYVDIQHSKKTISIAADSLAFTYCQVPVVYNKANHENIEVHFRNGKSIKQDTLTLDNSTSHQLFNRSGEVEKVIVTINKSQLK